jgi:hypothetical protein
LNLYLFPVVSSGYQLREAQLFQSTCIIFNETGYSERHIPPSCFAILRTFNAYYYTYCEVGGKVCKQVNLLERNVLLAFLIGIRNRPSQDVEGKLDTRDLLCLTWRNALKFGGNSLGEVEIENSWLRLWPKILRHFNITVFFRF